MNKTETYETTYIRYPFAPLVKLGLALAAWLKIKANKPGKSGRAKPSRPFTGTIGHAA